MTAAFNISSSEFFQTPPVEINYVERIGNTFDHVPHD